MAVQVEADTNKRSIFARVREMSVDQFGRALLIAGVVIFVVCFIITRFEPIPGTLVRWIWEFIDEGYSNFGIELVSIALTVIVIDQLNRRRDERERKADLIAQMASPSNDFALEAVRQLKSKGWFKDGSLHGANLRGANLQGAELRGANLQGAELLGTNLQDAVLKDADLLGATFMGAKLSGANLGDANLQGAVLMVADLQNARLLNAHMQSAKLSNVKLQGTNLGGAKLRGAELWGAEFDETTTLPDGSKWTPDRNLREFTDPDGWAAGNYKPTADSDTSPGADAPPSP